PPYIRAGDIPKLAADVRDFEPRSALDGGPDGFAVIDRLLAGAPERLRAGGRLIVEIGFDQLEEARRRAEATGWSIEKTVIDGEGNPRVLRMRRGPKTQEPEA